MQELQEPQAEVEGLSLLVRLGARTCSALLILQFVTFYSLIFRARYHLGYWPDPYRPTPSALWQDLEPHIAVVYYGYPPFMLLPLFVLAAAFVERKRSPTASTQRDVRYMAVLWLALGLATYVDPGSFGEWYLD